MQVKIKLNSIKVRLNLNQTKQVKIEIKIIKLVESKINKIQINLIPENLNQVMKLK